MSLRSTLAVVAAALTLALPLAASAQNLKVGYVDSRRLLDEIEDGKAAEKRLTQWNAEREKELKGEQTALIKERDLLQKQGSAMNEDLRKRRGEEFQQRAMEYGVKEQRYNLEAMARQQAEMRPINEKVRKVVGDLARSQGFNFIFDEQDSGMLFAQTQYDVTNEVIRAYNALPKLPAPAPPKLPESKDMPLAKGAPAAKDAPLAKDAPVAKDAPTAKDAPKK